jgi:Xaa-Pro aminopeptidase
MVKTEEEIISLKKAVAITDDLYLEIREFVEAGKTEKEVYDFILKIIDESEADTYSFKPIVAAGANGAEPHHEATDYVIQEGDLVVVDFGVFYEGLASDMTRMIAVGEISDEQ